MKQFITLAFFACLFAAAHSQAPANYFEVFTKPAHSQGGGRFTLNRDSLLARINSVPDTASTYATFVISVDNPSNIDSLYFTLTNSLEQTVYTGALQYSSLSGGNFRVSGNTVYVTVGTYPYLKHFSATAQVKTTNGTTSAIRSFAKN